MKQRLILMCSVALLGMSVLTACNTPAQKTDSEQIVAGTYDWETAREKCIDDLTSVLNVLLAGDETSYIATRNEWLIRVQPEVQGAMFPSTYPPQGCSSTVSYMGYSGPEYNSEGTEYLMYTARCLNNETLESVDFTITITLARGQDGYNISGFSKEVIPNA